MRSGFIPLFLLVVATAIAVALFFPSDRDAPETHADIARPSTPAGSTSDKPRHAATPFPELAPKPISTPSPGSTAPDRKAGHEAVRPRVGERVERAVRDVTPQGITPGPRIDGPLTRVAGRTPPPPPPPRKTLFHRVIIMDAGTIRTGEATIRLTGIEAPAILTFCSDRAGKRWPCGRAARTALRRLVRTRAIACRAPRLRAGARVTLACSVGKTDLSLWLVNQGWAKAAPGAGEVLRKAEGDARKAGRGLWR